MPYLFIQTNTKLDDESSKQLVSLASQTIAELLGKPESYVMVSLSAANAMVFAGNDSPTAYLELKSLGLPTTRTRALSDQLCTLLEETCKIDKGRIYIEFSDPPRHMWGWNGTTF